ncbi:MAG: DUF721 domain-containing protein [Bacteroidales bacterium]|nr:DUF721 domain-containing protein [Bacteroidales bacterium]
MQSKEFNMADAIAATLRELNIDDVITPTQVHQAYHDVVGDLIGKMTLQLRYEKRTRILYVQLSSAALRREMSFRTTALVEAINKQLSTKAVVRVVLR